MYTKNITPSERKPWKTDAYFYDHMSWKADTLTPVCMRFAQADWGLGNYLPLRGWKTTTHTVTSTQLCTMTVD